MMVDGRGVTPPAPGQPKVSKKLLLPAKLPLSLIVDAFKVFVLRFANCAMDVGLGVATLPPPDPRTPRFRIELEPTKLRALYEPARPAIRGVCIPFWFMMVDGRPGAPGQPKVADGFPPAKFPFTFTLERKMVEGN
jgi:hypothetical protein